jgi:hypothetical protein
MSRSDGRLGPNDDDDDDNEGLANGWTKRPTVSKRKRRSRGWKEG